VGIRDWLRKRHFINSNACRIPPDSVGFEEQMTTPRNTVSKPLPSHYSLLDARICGLLILTLLCLGAVPILSPASPIYSEITELDVVPQNRFITTSRGDTDSVNEIVLVNSTPFKAETDWNHFAFYSSPRLSTTSDGCLVHFASPFSQNQISFIRTEDIFCRDYSELRLTVGLEVLSGAVNITLEYDFWNRRYRDLPEKWMTHSLVAGDSEVLTLDAPMALLRTVFPSLVANAWIYIRIESAQESSILITNASVVASAAESLSVISVDFQNTSNESLYENEMFSEIAQPPAVFIRDLNTNRNGTLYAKEANQTIYLLPGEYNFTYGWYDPDVYSDVIPIRYPLSIKISLHQNEKLLLQPRIRALKLHLLGIEGIMFRHGEIGLDYYTHFYFIRRGKGVLPAFLYIPYGTEKLSIRLYTYERFIDPILHNYGDTRIYESGTGDGKHNFMFSVTLPLVSLFGFSFGIGEAIASMFAIVLLGSILKKAKGKWHKEDLTTIVTNERFLPILLIFVSIFVPWYEYPTFYGSDPVINEYDAVFPPLSIFLQHTSGSLVSIASMPFWYLLVFLTLALFWYPLYVMLLSLKHSTLLNTKESFAKMLLRPILLDVLFLIPPILGSFPISYGSVFVFASLPIYALQLWFSEKLQPGGDGGDK